jgi:hypothetical protein
MRTHLALVLMMASAALPAQGEPAPMKLTTTGGIGVRSCATWLANADSEDHGSQWLLGFWSGSNVYKAGRGTVGSSTDGLGIIETVKKKCRAQPSATLMSVAVQLFNEFDREGK